VPDGGVVGAQEGVPQTGGGAGGEHARQPHSYTYVIGRASLI
jgi:hypothetical protein